MALIPEQVEQVQNDDNVLRRVKPEWIKKNGVPFSSNFSEDPDEWWLCPCEISCHLERLANMNHIEETYPESLLAKLNVGEIKEKDLGDVIHYPIEGDRSHSFIVRTKDTTIGKEKRAKLLANLAKML